MSIDYRDINKIVNNEEEKTSKFFQEKQEDYINPDKNPDKNPDTNVDNNPPKNPKVSKMEDLDKKGGSDKMDKIIVSKFADANVDALKDVLGKLKTLGESNEDAKKLAQELEIDFTKYQDFFSNSSISSLKGHT